MKQEKVYRINGFAQIKSFYSWVFNNQDKNVTTNHVSLYVFLINQNNRVNWVEWFKLPYDLGMTGACIGSRNTYYKCIADLSEWGLIEHKKGVNNWRAPLIKLCLLKNEQLPEQVPVPLPEQVPVPLVIQLPIQLPIHKYKLLTSNIKLITDNLNDVLNFLKNKKSNPDFIDDIIFLFKKEYEEANDIEYSVLNKGKERAAAAKILKEYKKKFPEADTAQAKTALESYFRACVKINDGWLKDNMSLPVLISKFNQINKILRNGKSRSTPGISNTEFNSFVNSIGE